ncbi:DoxX family membrane protein [Brachybacterium sp. EF45031]|uniref:DoxX family membrane protein n=1 Tax=Brachybacterium sillae TaxID=2810536 RepID=UPI00217ECC9F|nr:DoxX family membrane protein [Brachybacterium sillae]MCS6712295.1 DoxX family membrane protein [Brachybacterium sillae]
MGLGISTAILRAVPGAFILNSGIGKLGMDEGTATYLQEAAAKGLPIVKEMTPEQFGKFLTYGEIAVGAMLLAPFVPTRIAGAALTTFATGLVSSYFRTPGMTQKDGVRPTQEGTPLAKDTWLAAIGAALLLGGSTRR